MITVCAIPPICVECERKYANVGKMITNTSPVSTRQDLTTANGHNSLSEVLHCSHTCLILFSSNLFIVITFLRAILLAFQISLAMGNMRNENTWQILHRYLILYMICLFGCFFLFISPSPAWELTSSNTSSVMQQPWSVSPTFSGIDVLLHNILDNSLDPGQG